MITDIIEKLRELADSPVYAMRRGILLVAARNLEELTAELADVKYNHDEILAISNTIKENLFKKIAENRLLTAENEILKEALKLIKTSCFDYMEGAGMPEFGHYETMYILTHKALKEGEK